MAVLQVEKNGNAPSNAKVGDHIVTAGGTYEVLDGSQYTGKSAEELASAGVGYNPSSGLYSRKVSNVSNFTGKAQTTVPQLSLRTADTANQWRNAQNQKVAADLDSAYYQNRQDAYNTYMDSITRQNQQANNVNQAYLDNITQLYDDTYRNNNAALQRAASRGLTSSGLGNAMQVSALADASKQNAQLRYSRNTQLNDIETQMNNLTNQYNVNLDTLAKKLRSDKISALSNNEIAFLEQVMNIEEYNANAYNSALSTQQQQAYEAEQAMLDREYKSYESALDRELQKVLLQMQIDAGSFSGGYGYGGRGGYSRGYGGYGGYSYGSGSSSVSSTGINFSSNAAKNAYNMVENMALTTPGGFLEPDKLMINVVANNGGSAKELKALGQMARLNAISVGNGGGTVNLGDIRTGEINRPKPSTTTTTQKKDKITATVAGGYNLTTKKATYKKANVSNNKSKKNTGKVVKSGSASGRF